MFFDEFVSFSDIYTVVELDFEPKALRAKARQFDALSVRLSGDADFVFDSGERLHAGTGDIIFVPKDVGYFIDSHVEEHVICIHFDMPTRLGPAVFKPEDKEVFFSLFMKLLDVWSAKAPGYMFSAAAVMNNIMKNAVRQNARQSEQANGAQHAIFLQAKKLIEANYTSSELTVHGIARKCNISDIYLRKIFDKFLDISPKQYIDKLRIEYAAELLGTGYYSVADVAEKCGIPNTKHFSTFYKSKTGTPPSKTLK